jgi:hypothetical protein
MELGLPQGELTGSLEITKNPSRYRPPSSLENGVNAPDVSTVTKCTTQ